MIPTTLSFGRRWSTQTGTIILMKMICKKKWRQSRTLCLFILTLVLSMHLMSISEWAFIFKDHFLLSTGNSKFFLGTDSAPHPRSKKESGCGCAGIFSACNALELYVEIFDKQNKLEEVEAFTSFFGADFYGLNRNLEKITLVKKETHIPEMLPFGDDKLVPLRAGDTCSWQVKV